MAEQQKQQQPSKMAAHGCPAAARAHLGPVPAPEPAPAPVLVLSDEDDDLGAKPVHRKQDADSPFDLEPLIALEAKIKAELAADDEEEEDEDEDDPPNDVAGEVPMDAESPFDPEPLIALEAKILAEQHQHHGIREVPQSVHGYAHLLCQNTQLEEDEYMTATADQPDGEGDDDGEYELAAEDARGSGRSAVDAEPTCGPFNF